MTISITDLKNAISTTLLVMLAILFLSNAASPHKLKDEVLNGKTFTILTLEGGKKITDPIVDELFFKSDKLKSKILAAENKFTPANYIVTTDHSSLKLNFDCESKNANAELLHWVGTVTGEDIEGIVTMYKKGKIKKQYAFAGTLKHK